MTAMRAWVRRGLIVEPTAKRVLDGYEMDWLARQIATDHHFWTSSSEESSTDDEVKDEVKDGPGTAGHGNGGYLIPESPVSWPMALHGEWATGSEVHGGKAQKAMKIRQRLGYLIRRTGPASTPAISVASAISTVMDKFSIVPLESPSDEYIGVLNHTAPSLLR
ncbi:hypothetical protein FN846DRAFT_886623 [Sphaerosporella brunnea]|uniref:Uncharacterized protein n=1 Tax=Sphaerosporella brunnea TaxID=1250544 RepID=A0A5J5F8Z8_9PEZI|nr:hypothetical protein FN846DRAFT_886623 [Sphaerosporella brunnea]